MSVISTVIKALVAINVVYWLLLGIFGVEVEAFYNLFSFFLMLLPLLGGLLGLEISKNWGGCKSAVGKSLLFISLGVLMWATGFGISLYSALTTGDIPFPGVPDYFFVLMDPFYAIGLIFMIKFSGAKKSLNKKSHWKNLLLFLIPLGSLYLNYYLFFGDASYFEYIDSAVIFDLIYSGGSIAIMSLLIITMFFSVKKLGGKMRRSVYALFAGLILQYMGDITYSFVEADSVRLIGNIADYIFFLSLACVIWGLINFDTKKFAKQT
jgi:hypothetical protein